MLLPTSAIFAFNANLDHLLSPSEADLSKIEQRLPQLFRQIDECFSWGVQKEVAIDARTSETLLSSLKFQRTIVGGQAGNAAQQASALGVKCFLHSNFANESLLSRFSHPERIFVAGEQGFAPASGVAPQAPTAHHFVFQSPQSGTRFIASHDPVPLHLEDSFAQGITAKLAGIPKAFVGGFHLLKTPDRMRKLVEELRRWKEINPGLRIFCELGEFQSKEVLEAARKELLPFADMVGLNDTELASFGVELEELAQEAQALLFHSPQEQRLLPEKRLNRDALDFARKCACFKAQHAAFATLSQAEAANAEFVDCPAETVGLGDSFSCAYFMAD